MRKGFVQYYFLAHSFFLFFIFSSKLVVAEETLHAGSSGSKKKNDLNKVLSEQVQPSETVNSMQKFYSRLGVKPKGNEPFVVNMVRTESEGVSTYYLPTGNGGVISSASPMGFSPSNAGVAVGSKVSSPINREVVGPGFPVPSDSLEKAKQEAQQKKAIESELIPALNNIVESTKAKSFYEIIPLVSEAPTASTVGKIVPPEIRQSLNFANTDSGGGPGSDIPDTMSSSSSDNRSPSGETPADNSTQEASTQYYVNQAKNVLGVPENSTAPVSSNPVVSNAGSTELKNFLSSSLSNLMRADAHGGSASESAAVLNTMLRKPDFQYQAPRLLGDLSKVALFNQAAQASVLSAKDGVSVEDLKNIKKNYQLATGLSGPAIDDPKKQVLAKATKDSEVKGYSTAAQGFSLMNLLNAKVSSQNKKSDAKLASGTNNDLQNINKIADVEWLRVALWIGADPNLRKICGASKITETELAYKDLKGLAQQFESQGVLKLVNKYGEFVEDNKLWNDLLVDSIDLATSIAKSSYGLIAENSDVDEQILTLRLKAKLESYHLESSYSTLPARKLAAQSELKTAQKHVKELDRLFEDESLLQFWVKKLPVEFKKIQQAYGALLFYVNFSPLAAQEKQANQRLVDLATCANSYLTSAEYKKAK